MRKTPIFYKIQVTAIQCNFIKIPYDSQPDLNNNVNLLNLRNRNTRLRRSNNPEPFICEEILPQDNNNSYIPV